MGTKFFVLLLAILPAFGSRVSGMVVTSGNTIIIDHPVTQDLYLAGGTIIINAPVYGDIVVAGGKIYINDSAAHDVLVAGGTVIIKGYVGGRVRCIGGTVKVDEWVKGDLVAAGGDVSVEKRAGVKGSVLAAGGNLTIYGEVEEDVRVNAGKFLLYGRVGRDLDCQAGVIGIHGEVGGEAKIAASESMEIGYSALFKGPVRYWAPETVNFGTAVHTGQAVRDETMAISLRRWYFLGGSGLLALLWYLGMALLLIVLLQYLFRPLFSRAGEHAYEHALRSFGSGLLFFLGMPLLIGLTFLTLVGIPVAFILLFGYVIVVLISCSITSLVAAHLFSTWMGSNGKFWEQVWMALLFFVLLRLIMSIPLFGWIIFPIMVCIAIGAIGLSVQWRKKKA